MTFSNSLYTVLPNIVLHFTWLTMYDVYIYVLAILLRIKFFISENCIVRIRHLARDFSQKLNNTFDFFRMLAWRNYVSGSPSYRLKRLDNARKEKLKRNPLLNEILAREITCSRSIFKSSMLHSRCLCGKILLVPRTEQDKIDQSIEMNDEKYPSSNEFQFSERGSLFFFNVT